MKRSVLTGLLQSVVFLAAISAFESGAGAQTDTAPAVSDLSEPVRLTVGRSTVLRAPWPVKRTSVTEPAIADIQPLTPTQVLVSAKGIGSTDVILWNGEEEIRQIQVEVSADRASVQRELARMFPKADLNVQQSKDVIIVSGTLGRAEDAVQLRKYFEAFDLKYVDLTTIPGLQQVQLKVMLAECTRTAVRSLGINAFYAGDDVIGGITIGPDSGGALNPSALPTSATTIFANFPNSDLSIFIQALAENSYLRILAEPSLVAMSGEEASFLAGGEFPIPVVQGVNATSISVSYKEFGVRLHFRPVVLGDGVIRLHVAPEVSELTNAGSVTLQGFSIPGLFTRRAETTLELNSGQTFAMAGLISTNTQSRVSRIPHIGDLPVLGALFRSVRFAKNETELVLLVTASLVDPLSVGSPPPTPGATYTEPNDWEVYAEGRIEGKTPARLSPADAKWLKDSGLDRLRGPGAWANYGTPTAVSQSSMAPENAHESSAIPATQPD